MLTFFYFNVKTYNIDMFNKINKNIMEVQNEEKNVSQSVGVCFIFN